MTGLRGQTLASDSTTFPQLQAPLSDVPYTDNRDIKQGHKIVALLYTCQLRSANGRAAHVSRLSVAVALRRISATIKPGFNKYQKSDRHRDVGDDMMAPNTSGSNSSLVWVALQEGVARDSYMILLL